VGPSGKGAKGEEHYPLYRRHAYTRSFKVLKPTTDDRRESDTSFISIYLCLVFLFNDAVSNSGYIGLASNDKMINELERIWKDAVVTYF
jgi:hypothetical protein